MLPATCRWDYVSVGYTRFYVREWVRYPSYLCAGGHVRVGDSCQRCEPVYATYRCNVAAPYEAMRPRVRYKENVRYAADVRHVVRSADRYEPIREQNVRVKTRETVRVVSTSREIADFYGIGVRTVEFHRANVMAKLGATNTAELVAHARGRGMMA